MTSRNKYKKAYIKILISLVALTILSLWIAGCLEEQWEEPEIIHEEEMCDAEFDETYRCNGEVKELCRGGYWRPWEDCSHLPDGTCEVDEKSGAIYCYAPPVEEDGGGGTDE